MFGLHYASSKVKLEQGKRKFAFVSIGFLFALSLKVVER